METRLKKIKYGILIPLLVFVRSLVLGKRKNLRNTSDSDSQFFIMGSGRNGSTLLALLLNRHSDIFLPPEQYVLPYSIISSYLKVFQSWESFCSETLNNYQRKNRKWALQPSHYSDLAQELSGLHKDYRKPSNIFTALLRKYADLINVKARVFGDHSPAVTLLYKMVYSEFPNAKYVMLIRNPLDVVSSYSKIQENPASDPNYAAWKWNNSIAAYTWLKKKKASVMLVKYEELVLAPEQTVKNVLSFLGADNQNIVTKNEPVSGADGLGVKSYSYHKNLYKPITGRSIGRWKTELDATVVKKVSPIVKTNAIKFGYNISDVKT